ncbi:hypothetical protein SIN07_05680 [Pediococcus inopinatus]|uniref:hypothetical protein n=1 Tax=Pediococcus inopinatus TaxID=114090 RepID=UPI002A6AF599|nr:hypothetical protein [Pediococcus inopinatus]WPP08535.1 hypothetical protein SIN07_05680 [Pediococcus inopinatus]
MITVVRIILAIIAGYLALSIISFFANISSIASSLKTIADTEEEKLWIKERLNSNENKGEK